MNIQYVQRIKAPLETELAKTVMSGTASDMDGAIPDYYSRPGAEKTELDRRAIACLDSLIPRDYMGSAEFELGAVAKALRALIAKRKELTGIDFKLTGSPVVGLTPGGKPYPESTVSVYVVCAKAQEQALRDWFVAQAREKGTGWMKEPAYVRQALWGRANRTGRDREIIMGDIVGWLDIENHWFASKDARQFNGFCRLFGLFW